MNTSAGISLGPGRALLRELRRAARHHALMLVLVAVVSSAGLSSLVAAGLVAAQASALAACHDEREQAGVGRMAARRAADRPERDARFLYRVLGDEIGYRVHLVVKDGPFLGDSWEVDAFGQLHHAHDVCRDRQGGRLSAQLSVSLSEHLLARSERRR